MNPSLDDFGANFFVSTVRIALDDYFMQYGFKYSISDLSKVIYCNKGDIYLEISYWVEDYPNYYLMLNIGFIKRNNDLILYEGIGLWRNLPEECYKNWRFSNEIELKGCLIDISRNILGKYAKSLWTNPIKLQELIDEQRVEFRMKSEKLVQSQILAEAKRAYESIRYDLAKELYERMGLDNLTATERKVHYICSKNINSSQ